MLYRYDRDAAAARSTRSERPRIRKRDHAAPHLEDRLDALLLLDGPQARLLALPLDLLQDRLTLPELLLYFFFALRVADRRFLGDARLGLDAHGLEFFGDLALLLRDGAHRLEFFRHCLRSPRLHFLFLRLDLRGSMPVSLRVDGVWERRRALHAVDATLSSLLAE